VRLAQAAVTLVQLAAGVIIAAELTGVGLTVLSQPAPPGHSLPDWLIVVAGIPVHHWPCLAVQCADAGRAVDAAAGLPALAGNPRIQGFSDIRDATSETVALTLGLIAGAVPAAIAAYRRRARPA